MFVLTGLVLGLVMWFIPQASSPEMNRIFTSISCFVILSFVQVVRTKNKKMKDLVADKDFWRGLHYRQAEYLNDFFPEEVQEGEVTRVLSIRARSCDEASKLVISLQQGGLLEAGLQGSPEDFEHHYNDAKERFREAQDYFYETYDFAALSLPRKSLLRDRSYHSYL